MEGQDNSYNILVADDSVFNCRVLGDLIKQEGKNHRSKNLDFLKVSLSGAGWTGSSKSTPREWG